MGDLGMHALHIPLRVGWMPHNVRALLSKIVTERPDGKGGMAPVRNLGQRDPGVRGARPRSSTSRC